MTLPKSHFESLEHQLSVHEERLDLLRWYSDNILEGKMHHKEVPAKTVSKKRGSALIQKLSEAAADPNPKVRTPEWIAYQRELLKREIRIHEQLLKLGQDPKVLDALGDLAENRDYASKVAGDPKGAALKRGIRLPANMTLHIDLEPDRVRLQISYYDDLVPFMITWNSDSGFLPLRESGVSQKATSNVSLFK